MAKTATVHTSTDEEVMFTRFNMWQRIEHFIQMIGFTGLCLTGLPQKFYDADWAQWMIISLGGIDTTRFIHRTLAAIFVMQAGLHILNMLVSIVRGSFRPSMVPFPKDFRDSIDSLWYCLGVSNKAPLFDRYEYRQKFEYWGVVLGALIMIVTGLVLTFPAQATILLPGELVPAAKEMHSGEALLAFLVIVIWHMYGAHFNPLRFPGDVTIFTGKISKERMLEEHPLEWARATDQTIEEVEEELRKLEEAHNTPHQPRPAQPTSG